VTIHPVDLVDYVAIAAEVTGMDAATVARLPNLAVAEFALHARFAAFGDREFCPEFVDKAAFLLERLARIDPLPDGNKRAAWVALRVFVEITEWTWQPYATVDEAERAVLEIAAGDWDHARIAAGRAPRADLRRSVRPRPPQANTRKRNELTIAFVWTPSHERSPLWVTHNDTNGRARTLAIHLAFARPERQSSGPLAPRPGGSCDPLTTTFPAYQLYATPSMESRSRDSLHSAPWACSPKRSPAAPP
jgi:death on curing protein